MALLTKIKTRPNPLSQFSQEYGNLVYPQLTGPIRNRMMFQNKEMIIWSLNNYLGLSWDERVLEFEAVATREYGTSYPGGSRMLSGNTSFHDDLEHELKKITGKDSMLFNLVYAGMISTLQSLLDRNDILIYDQQVHACIIDGVKTHVGERYSFRHNDIEHLKQILERIKLARKANTEILVVVDGVFSMSGHLAKLDEIVKLKKEFDFSILVDDAHGFMILQEGSTPDFFKVMEDIDIYVGAFGKALGNDGGFISADKELIDYFKFSLRSQIFGRSLSILTVISVLFKLKILENDSQLIDALWRNTRSLQDGLKSLGVNIGDTKSAITPIYLSGDAKDGVELIYKLRNEHNIFCSGVTYPVTPKGTNLLRLVPTALHTEEDIRETLSALSKVLNLSSLQQPSFDVSEG